MAELRGEGCPPTSDWCPVSKQEVAAKDPAPPASPHPRPLPGHPQDLYADLHSSNKCLHSEAPLLGEHSIEASAKTTFRGKGGPKTLFSTLRIHYCPGPSLPPFSWPSRSINSQTLLGGGLPLHWDDPPSTLAHRTLTGNHSVGTN